MSSSTTSTTSSYSNPPTPSSSSPSENISQASSNSPPPLLSSPIEMNSSQKLKENKSFSTKINGQENLFETITKLIEINNNNNNNVKDDEKTLKINKLNYEKFEENYNLNKLINQKEDLLQKQLISPNNYLTTSSRRKNGNPTRMIDENITKYLKRKRDKEEENLNNLNENEEKYKNNKLLGNEIQLINNSNKIKINELLENNNNNNNLLTINNECTTSSLLNNIVDKIEKEGEEEEEEGIMKEEIEEGVEQQQQQQQYKQQFYFQFIQQYIQQQYKQGNNKNIIDIYQNFGKNSKSLKEELNGIFNGINIDKVFGDFSSQELYSNVNRLFSTLQKNVHQINEQFGGFFLNNINSSSSFPIQYSSSSSLPSRILNNNNNMPFLSSLINSSSSSSFSSSSSLPFNAFLTITQNPLIATAMSTALANSFTKQQQQNLINNQNGIFPPTKIITETNKFINQSPTSRPIINLQKYLIKKENDGSPRKKRQKVTDSVRGPRSNLHCREQINYSTTTSERSTPGNGGYLPPTMVHSHNQIFRSPDKDGSPSDDEEKDNNNYFINESLKSQLTHVHLRKAKLMFFYQRYPSSSVLKSYFPDVKFNKHNTAQLVKWFSNFREFFYMQMEKFAKQSLEEGINNQEEIIVTSESEIFKQLNQHYNKNNVFQPPERLQFVVQETLREFFNALKEQRDLEPSWKKSIYKIIQQLDEPIPEYFRDSQFVEILENAP